LSSANNRREGRKLKGNSEPSKSLLVIDAHKERSRKSHPVDGGEKWVASGWRWAAVAFRATPFQPFNRSEQTVAHLFPCPVALRLELITHTTRWPCLKSRGCRVRESQIWFTCAPLARKRTETLASF